MKRILITGKNSYIGNAVAEYLLQYNEAAGEVCYEVERISLRGRKIEEIPMAGYDTVLHVAGKAHVDVSKASQEVQKEYYQVNCELAVETARKAASDGVKQFIYLSSVIVYGDSARVGKTKHVSAETEPTPANFYGDSKWQAEQKLRALETDMAIAVLRIPMIYGKGSKGNYPLLVRIAGKTPVFPRVNNQRSMLYVEHLAEFIRLLAESGQGGLFLPQEKEYINTAELVRSIGEVKGKRIRLWAVLNPFVRLASVVPGKIGNLANKAFGSLTMDMGADGRELGEYRLYSMEETIRRSV